MTWTQEEAIEFCCKIEFIAPLYGCHVALTGGCLYRKGPRKDCDIVIYRIRQIEVVNFVGMMKELSYMGVEVLPLTEDQKEYSGPWVRKAIFEGKKIDFFFPEAEAIVLAAEQELSLD